MRTCLLYFCLAFFIFVFSNHNVKAALPFVTDDAFVQEPKQLALETFVERWNLSKKEVAEKNATTVYGYFLSGSYGLAKNLELTMAGNIGYDAKKDSTSFMNPILQLKTKIFEHKNPSIPSIAFDLGYANKNGKGEYFDTATNYYGIAAATSRFLNDKIIVHLNFGKKASYDIPHNHIIRTHLGIGLDIALLQKIRLVVESYNGAPNSPRDSPDFFRSSQVGLKWLKSDRSSFYVIYGNQPTYAGNDSSGNFIHRNTSWVQLGARIVFDGFFD